MTVTAQAQVRFAEGRLDAWWSPRVWWRQLRVRCLLGDGHWHDAARWLPIVGGRFATDCGPVRVLVAPAHSGERLELRARVEAPTETAVRELTLVGDVALPGSTGPEWVLLGGYQSWDPAGHAPVQAGPPDGRRRTHESWWTVALADRLGAGLVGAADRAHVSGTRFTVTGSELAMSWCQPAREGHSEPLLPAGHAGEWDSDPVVVAATADVRQGLSDLMRARDARQATPDGVPRGWLSWYHLGPWVQPEDILEHSRLLAGHPYRELGYDVVQLDDGWQEAYGDWVPNAKFRGGFRPIAGQLAARGQTLGVWTAPFLVSEVSQLATTAPDDWFVFDPTTGKRAVDPRQVVFGPMHILDASNPEVRAHLRDTFQELHEQGVRYFKADFLYAGGYPGVGALRAGVEAIRQGVGDAYLLACGAPLLPVVGLADGCRIGPDTATPLYDFEAGGARPTIFADEVTAVARNVGALTHWAGRFQIDTDVALVGGNLELEQGRQLVTIAALSGGPFFASDDLRQLPPERLALLTNPEVLALAGGPPAVPDWEPDDRNRPPGQWRRGDVVAVFNWSEVGVEAAVRAPGATGARDLWTGRDLPEFRDGSPVEVPAQGVRLLRLFRR
jgi:alpha-galactosidase